MSTPQLPQPQPPCASTSRPRSPRRIPLLAAGFLLVASSLAGAAPVSAASTALQAKLAAIPAARAGAVSGARPVLDPLSAMTVRAGLVADQPLHASDADGDPLTFSKEFGPSYVTVTTIDPGSGSALGNVRLAPTIADVGTANARIGASDGASTTQVLLSMVVRALLNQPEDMVVDEGSTADQTLSILDPEGGTFTFSLASGPGFVTVATTSDSTGIVHLAPGYADVGSYRATISVTDGALVDEKSFQIRVVDVNLPPSLAQPADMHAVPGTVTDQALTASDPDGQALTFLMVSGPPFMYVGAGYVRLAPWYRDIGTSVGTVAVTDGSLSDQKSFAIRVDLSNAAPVLATPQDMDLLEGTDEDQVVSAFDPDGQVLEFLVWHQPRFMSIVALRGSPGSQSTSARIRLVPSYADAGAYTPTLVVSDGYDRVEKPFKITVRDAYPGETSLRLALVPAGEVPELPMNEYSVMDGNFTTYLVPEGNFLLFDFRDSRRGTSWQVQVRSPDGFPLAEGRYENVIINGDWSGRSLLVLGSDPDLPGLSGCSQGIANFTIERFTRRVDGSLRSFWATFDQTCGDPPHSLRGEVRYQVPSIPITLVAPRWHLTSANEKFWFEISAVDTARDVITLTASGVPPGANFVDLGGGIGRLGWTPTREQHGDYPIRFIASSSGGLADTALTTVRVSLLNHPPAARSNGPYEGTVGVPIPFTAAGTHDLDGDPLSYLWHFGDGTTGTGPAPSHSYRATGPYPILLVVTDGSLSGSDPTLATISQSRTGRAFVAGEGGPIRLEAGSARFCATIEVGARLENREAVDASTIHLRVEGLGDVAAIVAESTSVVVGDADRNGMSEITACFRRTDLRRLLATVGGRASVHAVMDVSLRDGHGWWAPLELDVIGPGPELAVLIAPNPFNPAGTFSFVTRRVGAARLRLFDSRGSLVRTLLDAASLGPGYHDVVIDGSSVRSSGIYFYRLETADGNRTGRIAVVK